MAAIGGRLPVPLEQMTTSFEPRPPQKHVSDIELVELYYSIHIRDKLAKTIAMPEPNLRHLVALYNMYDAITLGKYQLYLDRIRAHDIAVDRASLPQTSSYYNREYCKTLDGLSSASAQCDKSLPFRLDNIHLNF
jgi:hypothetical protein